MTQHHSEIIDRLQRSLDAAEIERNAAQHECRELRRQLAAAQEQSAFIIAQGDDLREQMQHLRDMPDDAPATLLP